LLVFTAAITVAAGLIAGCGPAALSGALNPFSSAAIAWLGFVIAAVGLTVSFFHLGKAHRALMAVLGVAHSWLSREVMLAAAFAGCTLAAAVAGTLGSDWTAVLLIAAAVFGLAATMTIGMIYNLPGQYGWSGIGNRLGPLISTVYLAAAVALGWAGIIWAHWVFWPALVLDFLLSIDRYGTFRAKKSTPMLFPRLRRITTVGHVARLIIGSILPAGWVLVVAIIKMQAGQASATGGLALTNMVVPFFIAAAIVLDRLVFYAGTVQASPRAEVARVKGERMARAVREAKSGLRGGSKLG
jgi:hypothetical protein